MSGSLSSINMPVSLFSSSNSCSSLVSPTSTSTPLSSHTSQDMSLPLSTVTSYSRPLGDHTVNILTLNSETTNHQSICHHLSQNPSVNITSDLETLKNEGLAAAEAIKNSALGHEKRSFRATIIFAVALVIIIVAALILASLGSPLATYAAYLSFAMMGSMFITRVISVYYVLKAKDVARFEIQIKEHWHNPSFYSRFEEYIGGFANRFAQAQSSNDLLDVLNSAKGAVDIAGGGRRIVDKWKGVFNKTDWMSDRGVSIKEIIDKAFSLARKEKGTEKSCNLKVLVEKIEALDKQATECLNLADDEVKKLTQRNQYSCSRYDEEQKNAKLEGLIKLGPQP